ncbi:DUF4082 domain-containing protein [Salinibacterium sp. M195]|uniref:DUF4082 domain-containing protein n=1 Tax=Salinibacterium sp. M195 TaxID=2583374 RepID=UPI001C6260EE|nr:DUF4082 domain-containing protein [Salinibacterium sp. M195]
MRFARPRTIIAFFVTAALLIAGAVSLSGQAVARTADHASAATSTNIWGDSKPTGAALDTDPLGAELGTTFIPAVDGQATAIRFYKVKGVTGKHTGSIWDADGTQMATVTFTDESDSGWQTATLSKPVSLTSGTSYVVSYRVPAGGYYAATENFSGKSSSEHLDVSRSNSGVYSYSQSGSHPRSQWRSSQYWADLTFVPAEGSGAGEGTTPTPTEPTTPTPAPTEPPTPTEPTTPVPAPTEPTTPVPAPTEPTTPAPTPTDPPSSSTAGFPTRTSAGLPSGWQPTKQVNGNYYVRTAGAVVEDLRITNGTIIIEAANVTVRRVQFVGSSLVNGAGPACFPNVLIEDSEFTANGTTRDNDSPVIQFGGYTARNIVIDGVPEGLRVGGSDIGCGPVTVADSFIRVKSPDVCTDGWHGDGIQGYGGDKLTVRNTTIIMDVVNDCYGTSPFFYPKNQGNTAVDIDGLLVGGSSGYPFRSGMPGPVKNLNVIEGSWVYGPVDVNCSVTSAFDAQVVKLDAAGQPVSTGKKIGCTGEGN